jgi:hypothetical protein
MKLRVLGIIALCLCCALMVVSVGFPPSDLERDAPSVTFEPPPPTTMLDTPTSVPRVALSFPNSAVHTTQWDRGQQRPHSTSVIIGGKERGPSEAFVTGDGFRLMADYIFDETTQDTLSVAAAVAACTNEKHTPIVFVQTHLLMKFLTLWGPMPHTCRIRLLTHNSDYSSPWEPSNTRWKGGVATEYAQQRRDVLENADVDRWYGQNVVIVHPKLHPIPIGLENRYNKYGAHYDIYKDVGTDALPALARRSRTLFVSFNLKTNPRERGQALQAAKDLSKRNADLVTFYHGTPPKKGSPAEYRAALRKFLTEMTQHQFVLAPHGHGVDTHRLWEALYVGCIPIVLRSSMDKLLEGLPVLLVEHYADISEALLDKAAARLAPRFDSAKQTYLNLTYWAATFRA